jgi:hypothetical protein
MPIINCENCQKKGQAKNFKQCNECKSAYYCDKGCQNAHKERHQVDCATTKARDLEKQLDAAKSSSARKPLARNPTLASVAPLPFSFKAHVESIQRLFRDWESSRNTRKDDQNGLSISHDLVKRGIDIFRVSTESINSDSSDLEKIRVIQLIYDLNKIFLDCINYELTFKGPNISERLIKLMKL